MTTKIAKRQKTEVRQKQIINAARGLILRHGSEHITVRRIAETMDLSEAAIYRHFKSKRAILALLVDDIENRWMADLTSSSVANGKSPLEIIEAGLKGPFSVRRRGVSFQVIAEIVSLGDRKLNNKIFLMIDKYMERISDTFSRGVAAGEVRADLDAKAAATILFGMMQGLVCIWALNGYSFDPGEKYSNLWKVFREAVIPRREAMQAHARQN